MTSQQLNNLVKVGQLKTEPGSQAEFNGLLHSGTARLIDARNKTLAIESRFDLAYNAAHAREALIQSNMACVQTKTGLIKARDAGRSRDYDAKEGNAEQACFRLNPKGRGVAGAMRCRESLVQNYCTARFSPCLASRNTSSQPCLIESVLPLR